MTYNSDGLPEPKSHSRQNEATINKAIEECTSACNGNPDPFSAVEAYAIALIGDGWSAEDARVVQAGALRFLSKLTGNDSLWPAT
jgi:hypothetical protein